MKKQLEWDWDNIPVGSTFTAFIDGDKVQGRIQKEGGSIYLCQNEVDGFNAENKLGYEKSWLINSGSLDDIEENCVTDLEIFLPEHGWSPPESLPLIGDYVVIVRESGIEVGCTYVPFEIIEYYYNKVKEFRGGAEK